VLYAPPELPAEHSVFLSYLFLQGVTISNTQLITIKLNQINGNKIVSKSEYRGPTCARTRRVKSEKLWSSYNLGWLLGRHLGVLTWLRLLHDIELNPGPEPNVNCQNETIIALTQQCRGLGSMDKTRLLLNKMYNLARKTTVIAMLQETMITTDKYLELAWRGGFVHTPGTGNSQGCVTLISTNDEISEVKHYGNRGHVFTLSQATGENIKICNVYAPNGFDETKANFFNEVLNDLEMWEGNIILAGDFNITLSPSERFCRGVTVAEQRLADTLRLKVQNMGLYDSWEGRTGFTWRRGKSMSRLDRIYIRTLNYAISNCKTYWTLTASDHAGIILTLRHRHNTLNKNEHVKLDNELLKDVNNLNEIKTYLTEQLETASGMEPHIFANSSLQCLQRCQYALKH